MSIKFAKFLRIGIPLVVILIIGLLFGYSIISLVMVWRYPSWIKTRIFSQSLLPKSDPPSSVTRCFYKTQSVYYIPPKCCNISGFVYDENGFKICSPDGESSETGVPNCRDFFAERRKCTDIWKDIR
jgi:hypothetical protein